MPIQILMPALSPTMEEGKLAAWLVKEGDAVTPGMVIAEIETDKATMEVEAVDEGTVGKILVAEGTEGVAVNTPIATLLEEGESADSLAAVAAQPAASPPSATPQPQTQPGASVSPAAAAATTAIATEPNPAPVVQPPPAAPSTPATQSTNGARIFASPLAKRVAKENGIDLGGLTGSGPHNRIVLKDVETAIANGGARAVQSSAGRSVVPQGATVQGGASQAVTVAGMADQQVLALYQDDTYEVVPHDGMRKVIAQRLTQSKQTVPHFYLSMDCVLDELLRSRTRINEAAPSEGPRAYKLSVNDFVIKALALALQQVPAANATWTEAGMLVHRHSDVGVAVAVEGGLFTPIIRHAELKTLGEISNEMKDLAGRARNRRLAPQEYQGGTTSISNLGMFGVKSFDAVINPPHATILAVGAGEKRAIVDGNDVRVATIMSCTLSCDHRVVDGAVGAELLNAFKRFIEDPVRMLV
ncbi:MAG: pyruvate dehydrogenase complex dihydrolipoamide acetyltransferase [Pseudomonadota bacterium]